MSDSSNTTNDDFTLNTHGLVLLFSGISMVIAFGFSFYLIRKHLEFFTKPEVQSKILGIIYMVPIYSLDSYLGLMWPEYALYINMLRDCYEVSASSPS